MAFNLQKVLKALLFSSSQPLAIKDIQAAFTRFHEQAVPAPLEEGEAGAAPAERTEGASAPEGGAATSSVPDEATEVIAEAPEDAELYQDVPSLITATQIREAMDAIAAEMRARDDGLLLIEGSNGYRLVTQPRFARWVRILRQEPPPLKLSQSAIETLAIVAYRQPVTRTEIETIRGVSAEAGINKLIERELIYIVGRADLPGRPIQYGTTDKFLEFVGIKSLDELPASDVLSSRQVSEWLESANNSQKPGDADMGLEQENLPLEQQAATAADETLTADSAEESASPAEAMPEATPEVASTEQSSEEKPA